ncbi:hypothetical protein [Wenjunlia vitaminophila]|uniref:hypothetical protein n=1 Tax=Wenjunlia vitaminophila TaxID=76728 RepID=UPI0003687105|nr:hypothetical protein [Wenjunlia vitaminophila]
MIRRMFRTPPPPATTPAPVPAVTGWTPHPRTVHLLADLPRDGAGGDLDHLAREVRALARICAEQEERARQAETVVACLETQRAQLDAEVAGLRARVETVALTPREQALADRLAEVTGANVSLTRDLAAARRRLEDRARPADTTAWEPCPHHENPACQDRPVRIGGTGGHYHPAGGAQ